MSTLARMTGRLGIAILIGSLSLFALVFTVAILGPFSIVPIGFAVWWWVARQREKRAAAARLAAARAQWGLR